MTGVERAKQAVERARTAVVRELTNPTEWVTGEVGATDKDAMRLVDALIEAVEARCRARVGDEIRAFAEAAGPAQNTDLAKVGYIGGLVVAETIARATEPGLNATIAALVHPDTQEQP